MTKNGLQQLAIRFLSIRNRSEKELREYLEKKSVQLQSDAPEVSKEVIIEQIIDQMKELDYINDQKFAMWYVECRRRNHQRGAYVLKQELLQKGISSELIEQVLNQSDGHDEHDAALLYITKKMRHWDLLPKQLQKNKMQQSLWQRGFSSDIIRGVIDEVLKKD